MWLWEREPPGEVGRLALRGVAGRKITRTPHPASGHPLPSSDEGRGQGEGCFQVLQTAFSSSFQTTRVTGCCYRLVEQYRCSTSKFGIGQVAGSNCTPLGWHRIARKVGGGWPVGTVFKSRQPVGFTWKGMPLASITTRILWLEGLEPGFNRGGDVDTFRRYIYIHGTGDEPTLGRPASHGCIHLAADDLIPLYERLPVGTLVWIGR
jgi:L,D-transpeptidase YbiS